MFSFLKGFFVNIFRVKLVFFKFEKDYDCICFIFVIYLLFFRRFLDISDVMRFFLILLNFMVVVLNMFIFIIFKIIGLLYL